MMKAKALKISSAIALALVLLAAGYEAGVSASKVSPIGALEYSGAVIGDGGGLRASARVRM